VVKYERIFIFYKYRAMAQPPLMLKAPFQLKSKPEDTYPVEKAILEAISD
jgi:hypothetical protein